MAHDATAGHPSLVTGLFSDRESAERAYCAAIARGYEDSDLNLVMSRETREREFSGPASGRPLDEKSRKEAESAAESSALGGPPGATAGTIAPALAAVGTVMLIPGLIAAGPIAIALVAAGTVGIAGGIAGALADWGVPRPRLKEYEAGIREGAILLGVKPHSAADARALKEEWESAGGRHVHA